MARSFDPRSVLRLIINWLFNGFMVKHELKINIGKKKISGMFRSTIELLKVVSVCRRKFSTNVDALNKWILREEVRCGICVGLTAARLLELFELVSNIGGIDRRWPYLLWCGQKQSSQIIDPDNSVSEMLINTSGPPLSEVRVSITEDSSVLVECRYT